MVGVGCAMQCAQSQNRALPAGRGPRQRLHNPGHGGPLHSVHSAEGRTRNTAICGSRSTVVCSCGVPWFVGECLARPRTVPADGRARVGVSLGCRSAGRCVCAIRLMFVDAQKRSTPRSTLLGYKRGYSGVHMEVFAYLKKSTSYLHKRNRHSCRCQAVFIAEIRRGPLFRENPFGWCRSPESNRDAIAGGGF